MPCKKKTQFESEFKYYMYLKQFAICYKWWETYINQICKEDLCPAWVVYWLICTILGKDYFHKACTGSHTHQNRGRNQRPRRMVPDIFIHEWEKEGEY